MEKIIAVSACETIEETLAFAIEQLEENHLKQISFIFAGSKYTIEKEIITK